MHGLGLDDLTGATGAVEFKKEARRTDVAADNVADLLSGQYSLHTHARTVVRGRKTERERARDCACLRTSPLAPYAHHPAANLGSPCHSGLFVSIFAPVLQGSLPLSNTRIWMLCRIRSSPFRNRCGKPPS